MSKNEKVTIHKLIFDFKYNNKDEFKQIGNRLSYLTKELLPNKISRILAEFDIPNGNLIIHKLEIDLGKIPPHSLENIILSTISNELSYFLVRKIDEIKRELKQAKFRQSEGEYFTIKKDGVEFKSEIFLPKTIGIQKNSQTVQQVNLSQKLKEVKTTKTQHKTLKTTSEKIKEISISKDKLPIKKEEVIILKPKVKEDKQISPKKEKVSKEIIPETKKSIIKLPVQEVKKDLKKANIPVLPTEQLQKKIQLPIQDEVPFVKSKQETPLPISDTKKPPILPIQKSPEPITPLDQTFLYYLKYGRLPSNVKYELGTSMLDVYNVNLSDGKHDKDLVRHISGDENAKRRLIQLLDNKNKNLLVDRRVLTKDDLTAFDPKTPRAFIDYFLALYSGSDTSSFTSAMKRYNMNDIIRFLYADHPQKLRALIKLALLELHSDKNLDDKISDLFGKIGKSSIVKIIASFSRKGGYVNRYLNQLNKENDSDSKAAHKVVMKALLEGVNPEDILSSQFKSKEKVSIQPRIFFSPEPNYALSGLSNEVIIDHFLNYGSIPFTIDGATPSLDRLNVMILMLSDRQIKNLSYFSKRKYLEGINYETIGKLSERALEHIIKNLAPDTLKNLSTKFKHFQYNIKAGIPDEFQKAFMLHYALKSNPKSYLEEMVSYWRSEIGDSDSVLKRRWQLSDELSKELDKIIVTTDKSLADKLKVDYEFQSYSRDISVKNAGLVILWPFLRTYFNLLELLTPKGDFRSMQERARACHLLQFLAVKQSFGEEFYYPLNKVLTGYPLEEPLPFEIKMTQKEIDVSTALLKNVIGQWNALGKGSVDNLRGSFLIRDGVLSPSSNGWLLTVEKKSFDVLLDKLPWGIGMIKLSWAPYVISVEWERKFM